MRCALVTIGTELLLGDTINTNAAYISKKLAEYGVSVFAHYTIGDNRERIIETLEIAFRNCDMIVTTGGLGPTEDDITRECIAEYLRVPLIVDQNSVAYIKEFFKKRDRDMSPSNLKQASFPESSQICANPVGTAPGAIIKKDDQMIIMLPGPPFELERMFDDHITPFLRAQGHGTIHSKVIHFCGIGESDVDAAVKDLQTELKNPTLAPYAKMGECLLRITAKANNLEAAETIIKPVQQEIEDRLSEYIYGYDDETLESRLVELLKKKGLTISCAESCTGGMLTSTIVNYPGSSSVLSGSLVAYNNHIKISHLGVPSSIIEKYGAVSQECALAMAQGCAKIFASDIAIAITGIAGPQGGGQDKPVGLVYVAFCCNTVCDSIKLLLTGDRYSVRLRTVKLALFNVIKKIEGMS